MRPEYMFAVIFVHQIKKIPNYDLDCTCIIFEGGWVWTLEYYNYFYVL